MAQLGQVCVCEAKGLVHTAVDYKVGHAGWQVLEGCAGIECAALEHESLQPGKSAERLQAAVAKALIADGKGLQPCQGAQRLQQLQAGLAVRPPSWGQYLSFTEGLTAVNLEIQFLQAANRCVSAKKTRMSACSRLLSVQ